MPNILVFIIGALAICLIGTMDVFNIPYPILYKIPIFLRGVLFIMPTAILTLILVVYLKRKNISPVGSIRLAIMFFIAVIGLIVIGNISAFFYYIGGAGYEYGTRVTPSWIYALWGSIPTFIMLAFFFFALIKFGITWHHSSEDTT